MTSYIDGTQPRKPQEYDPGRSALKALWSVAQAAGALVLTLAGALAVDPTLAAQLGAVFKDHPGAGVVIGGLVFVGRFLQDKAKHG